MAKSLKMEWGQVSATCWRLKRERPRVSAFSCMRFEVIGDVAKEWGGWSWSVRPDMPKEQITCVMGTSKSAKAAKRAVETVLRVLEES